MEQARVHARERDVHLERVAPREAREQVEVADDERRLGDHPELERGAGEQRLEQAPGHAEAELGRLVRVGGGADHDGAAAEPRGAKRPGQRAGRVELHQDAVLEVAVGVGVRRQHAGRRRPLDGPAMGVARVAVAAAELAADVGVHRPEAHPGAGRRVEHRAHRERDELHRGLGALAAGAQGRPVLEDGEGELGGHHGARCPVPNAQGVPGAQCPRGLSAGRGREVMPPPCTGHWAPGTGH